MKNSISAFEEEKRIQICEIGKRMYERDFVAANDGNISVLLNAETIICTPSGISKGYMKPEDLVTVNIDGEQISGDLHPTSEIKMHLEIYKRNKQARSVVHAHPVNATSLAVAGVSMEEHFLTESVLVTGPVPLAEYATAGTEDMCIAIRPFCTKYNSVLLANHGAVTWGNDLIQAWYRMESLEQMAEIYIKSKYLLGKCNYLDEKQVSKLKNRYNIK